MLELIGSMLTLKEASLKCDVFYEELGCLVNTIPGDLDTSKENVMNVLREGHCLIVVADSNDRVFMLSTVVVASTLWGKRWLLAGILNLAEATKEELKEAECIVIQQRNIFLDRSGTKYELHSAQGLLTYEY